MKNYQRMSIGFDPGSGDDWSAVTITAAQLGPGSNSMTLCSTPASKTNYFMGTQRDPVRRVEPKRLGGFGYWLSRWFFPLRAARLGLEYQRDVLNNQARHASLMVTRTVSFKYFQMPNLRVSWPKIEDLFKMESIASGALDFIYTDASKKDFIRSVKVGK